MVMAGIACGAVVDHDAVGVGMAESAERAELDTDALWLALARVAGGAVMVG